MDCGGEGGRGVSREVQLDGMEGRAVEAGGPSLSEYDDGAGARHRHPIAPRITSSP